MHKKLSAAVLAVALAGCGSASSVELPYVVPNSAEDVWDYYDADLRIRIRQVEYQTPLIVPGTTATTTTTVEIYTEPAGARAQVQIGAAVGNRVLHPMPWGFGWRLVEFNPTALHSGDLVSYGFISHDGPAQPYELNNSTTLKYRPNEILHYRRD